MAVSTETQLCNLALLRMGQELIDDIDGTDSVEVKCNTAYDQTRDETLVEGPKYGWKFAVRVYHGVDRDSTSITAFADYSGTVAGTTSVTSTAHGLLSGDMVEISGTTNYDGEYDVTYIDANTFYITKDYIADDATGTAYWTSEDYAYRYAVPSDCLPDGVRKVMVAGADITDWVCEGGYVLTNMESSEVDIRYIRQITDVTKFPEHFISVLVLKLAITLHYNLTQDLQAIQLLERDLYQKMPKAIAMDERRKYVQESSTSWVDAGHTTDFIE